MKKGLTIAFPMLSLGYMVRQPAVYERLKGTNQEVNMSTFSSWKKASEVSQEVYRVQQRIACGLTARCVTAVARSVLLGSPYGWQGRQVHVMGKSVGAGVWELREDKEHKS